MVSHLSSRVTISTLLHPTSPKENERESEASIPSNFGCPKGPAPSFPSRSNRGGLYSEVTSRKHPSPSGFPRTRICKNKRNKEGECGEFGFPTKSRGFQAPRYPGKNDFACVVVVVELKLSRRWGSVNVPSLSPDSPRECLRPSRSSERLFPFFFLLLGSLFSKDPTNCVGW